MLLLFLTLKTNLNLWNIVLKAVVELFNEYRRNMQPSQSEQVSDGSQMRQVTQYTCEINILQNKKRDEIRIQKV